MSLARQFRHIEVDETRARKPNAEELKWATTKARELGLIGRKRGPKPSADAKVLLTLRLKPSTIEKFKATGKGWQARMSDALDLASL